MKWTYIALKIETCHRARDTQLLVARAYYCPVHERRRSVHAVTIPTHWPKSNYLFNTELSPHVINVISILSLSSSMGSWVLTNLDVFLVKHIWSDFWTFHYFIVLLNAFNCTLLDNSYRASVTFRQFVDSEKERDQTVCGSGKWILHSTYYFEVYFSWFYNVCFWCRYGNWKRMNKE